MIFGVVGREKPPHGVVVVGTRWPNKLAKEQRREETQLHLFTSFPGITNSRSQG